MVPEMVNVRKHLCGGMLKLWLDKTVTTKEAEYILKSPQTDVTNSPDFSLPCKQLPCALVPLQEM